MRALFGNPNLPGVTDGSLVAHGQLVAALRTAAGKHRPAVLCLHTRQEPVSLGPLAVVRLKCTFWHGDLLGRTPDGKPARKTDT
jgi:hypothetical protein